MKTADGKGLLLSQLNIISKLEKQFRSEMEKIRVAKMPLPQVSVVTREEGEELISKERQKKYHSGVKSLLYLVKHSRLDITKATHELAKTMDEATTEHEKMLHKTIKYIVDTKTRVLSLEPKAPEGEQK